MSNKYQEALKRLRTNEYLTSREQREYYNLLQELVDKETPMLVTDIHVDEFYCPKCHAEITHSKSDIENRPKYCEYCGQKLDWSDSYD